MIDKQHISPLAQPIPYRHPRLHPRWHYQAHSNPSPALEKPSPNTEAENGSMVPSTTDAPNSEPEMTHPRPVGSHDRVEDANRADAEANRAYEGV